MVALPFRGKDHAKWYMPASDHKIRAASTKKKRKEEVAWCGASFMVTT